MGMALGGKVRGLGWRGLRAVVWALAVILAAASARATDLTVDHGATYIVNRNITYDREYVYGDFNQSGFTNTVSNRLSLGSSLPGGAFYNLSGGSLSAGYVYIGATGMSGGVGIFNQSSGCNSTDTLYLGGYDGSGIYNQSGGSNTTSRLQVGDYFGNGAYNLSGGSLSVNGYTNMYGLFNQSGGSNQSTFLSIGSADYGGIYNLGGGSLSTSMTNCATEFNQTGGSHVVTGELSLGISGFNEGVYNLSSGSLLANTEVIILGLFNQSGGTNTTGSLSMIGNSNRNTYNLRGGSLSVQSEVFDAAAFSEYAFNQTGGTNTTASLFLKGRYFGTSTYNLSGGSLTAGTVDLNTGGIFNQTGGSLNASLFNQQGGTVAGVLENLGRFNYLSGAFAGSLLNYGTVNVGAGTTFNVGGNYTQNAAGTLMTEIASPTSYDKLNVTGTASLNGTVQPVLLNGFRPQGNQVFHFFTATGGITGSFSNVANAQITNTLFWRLHYTPTSVDLLAQRDYANSSLNLTPNQRAVGNMLNGLADTATGDLNQVLNTIDNLSSGNDLAGAYQQISADKAASLATLGFAGADLFRRGLAHRITNLRYRTLGGVGGPGGLGSFNLNYSGASGLMLAYNSSSLAGLITAKKSAAPETSWGLYLDPALALGSQKSSNNQTGFNFTIAGFNAGADYRVRDDLLVGLASGYSHTGASFRGSGGAVENNTWPLTAYAAYLPESFYAYGSLGYALNLFSLERNLSFGSLSRVTTSSPTGHQFNAYGEAGYDIKASSLVLTPLVSLAYSNLWVNGFTESGAGSMNLQVDSQQADSLQTGVGAKVAMPLRRNGVTVVPQAYATYQHEFSNTSRGLDARLSQGGSTFAFQSEKLGQDFAVLGASVTLITQKNFSLHLDYNAEVGRKNYTASCVNGGLRYEF
jgi:outer membrane autotransporter protein